MKKDLTTNGKTDWGVIFSKGKFARFYHLYHSKYGMWNKKMGLDNLGMSINVVANILINE